jgi:hypothetical protein
MPCRTPGGQRALRRRPSQPHATPADLGPYAALVDDPDGNVVLLTSDAAARVDKNDA